MHLQDWELKIHVSCLGICFHWSPQRTMSNFSWWRFLTETALITTEFLVFLPQKSFSSSLGGDSPSWSNLEVEGIGNQLQCEPCVLLCWHLWVSWAHVWPWSPLHKVTSPCCPILSLLLSFFSCHLSCIQWSPAPLDSKADILLLTIPVCCKNCQKEPL